MGLDFQSLFRKMRPAIIEDQIPGKTTYIMRKDQHELRRYGIDHRYFLSDDKSERNIRERVKITNRKAGATCLAFLPRVAISQALRYFARSTFPVENEGILET